MARFDLDSSRINFTVEQRGTEWNLRVLKRTQIIFSALLDLLPSNYTSTIQGPSYTLELKAVALELAKFELALEDVSLDRDFSKTRSEFLYSVVGYLVFTNGKLPSMEFSDVDFRAFTLNLIRIYFKGSVPGALRDAADLFFGGASDVLENYLMARLGASGYDISDQFGFQIDIHTGGVFAEGLFELQKSLQAILDVIRPAHTLFRIRFIFEDSYSPNDTNGEILDTYRWGLASYYYEDYRSYWGGLRDRDLLGKKTNLRVTGEDHSRDF